MNQGDGIVESVFVTGAAGFIGKAVVKCLRQHGYYVFAMVRDRTGLCDLLDDPYIEPVVCSLDTLDQLPNLLAGKSIKYAIHLAWDGNAGKARSNLTLQLKNVSKSLELVRALYAINCKTFLGIGTISEQLVLNGDAACKTGNMIYAAAKVSTYTLVRALCSSLDIQFSWCRLANIYGPGNRTGNLMSYTIDSLTKGIYPTYSSATALQDFMYVDDCARAILSVLECTKRRSLYYIGTGNCQPLKEFLYQARDVIAPSAKLGIGERPDEQATYLESWFSISPLQEDTGFIPQVDFKDGILKTMRGSIL